MNELEPETPLEMTVRDEQQAQNRQDLDQILHAQKFEYTFWKQEAFPSVFVAMTPYMLRKFQKFQPVCYFGILWDAVYVDELCRNVGFLVGLNGNLGVSVLGLAVFQKTTVTPGQALESLLKFVNERCHIDHMILYCSHPEQVSAQIQQYNALYQKSIRLQTTFSQKQSQLRSILVNSRMARKPYLKKQAFELIAHIIAEKDEKKCNKFIEKFKQWNPDGYAQLLNQPRKFRFLFQLPRFFYGFLMLKKYEMLVLAFFRHLQKGKFKSVLDLINRVLQLEYEELELKRDPFVDPCSILQMNSRVKDLSNYIEPNPFSEFLQNYEKSLSFKQKKVNPDKYIIGGKAGSPYQVRKQNSQWVCQCGQTQRLGIPCEHLIKVCSLEKLNFEQYFSSMYKIGQQKPFLRIE